LYPILMDIHEPDLIQILLKNQLTIIKENNEPKGYADYFWNSPSGVIMIERKKGHELLGGIGKRLDKQLVKYREAHPQARVFILQEGFITPTEDDKCQTWKYIKNKNIFVRGRVSPVNYTAYKAYLFARSMEGVGTIVTANEQDTAQTLSCMVYNSMKSKHDGLKQDYVEKFRAKKGMDPVKVGYITMLSSIKGIGPKTAERLIDEWGNPWALFSLTWSALAEMENERIADAIVNGIGK